MTYIPIYNQRGEILQVYPFTANLNVRGPRYLNESCDMGLIRNKRGKLVLMYHHVEFPSSDHAEYITEDEAYELCQNRGKQSLIRELNIMPSYVEE